MRKRAVRQVSGRPGRRKAGSRREPVAPRHRAGYRRGADVPARFGSQCREVGASHDLSAAADAVDRVHPAIAEPFPVRPTPRANRSASAGNRPGQRRRHGCRRDRRRLPASREGARSDPPSAPAGRRYSADPQPRNLSSTASPSGTSSTRFAGARRTKPGPRQAPPPRPLRQWRDAASKPRARRRETPRPPGGLRDKLTAFEAERLQPRRDAEQARGAAGRGGRRRVP